MPDQHSREFTMGLLGDGVRLRVHDPKLLSWIRATYAPMPASAQSTWTITIRSKKQLPVDTFFGREIPFPLADSRHLWVRSAQALGFVDALEGHGEVLLLGGQERDGFALFLRMFYTQLGIRQGRTFVHAAGLLKDGRVSLFTGPSGAGKTTISRMLGWPLLHDDQLFLEEAADGLIHALVPPWMGQPGSASCEAPSYPVAKIYFLKKSAEVGLVPLEPLRAASRLVALPDARLCWSERADAQAMAARNLAMCTRLARQAPAFELAFGLDQLPAF